MNKRILAVLIAALAGGAYAQSNVPTQPVTTARVGSPPPSKGYVGSGAGVVATNPYGLCWRGGAEWTPATAAPPCDVAPSLAAAPLPVAPQAEPAPAPAPEPVARAEPPAPAPAPVVIEKITLSTDVLFEFNKAELREGGKQKLDQLAEQARDANVERIVLVGHADRIGSEEYNRELSERRAEAVAAYLEQKGIERGRLQVEGRGEAEPITANQCDRLGPDSNRNQKLIACLQPDRRVDAEFLGTREATASTGSPAATGATGSSDTPSRSSSGSGTNQ